MVYIVIDGGQKKKLTTAEAKAWQDAATRRMIERLQTRGNRLQRLLRYQRHLRQARALGDRQLAELLQSLIEAECRCQLHYQVWLDERHPRLRRRA